MSPQDRKMRTMGSKLVLAYTGDRSASRGLVRYLVGQMLRELVLIARQYVDRIQATWSVPT
jgi:hypothetical protein